MVDEKKIMVEAESEKMWKEISNLHIDVYAVQNQSVSNYVTKINLPGSELYVKLSSTAVLPALEATLSNMVYTRGKKYEIEPAQAYTVIRRVEDRDAKVHAAIADMEKKDKK